MPVRIEKAQTNESASSNDLQVVTTTVAVNFHLEPDNVNAVHRDIGDINAVYQRIVSPAISNAVTTNVSLSATSWVPISTAKPAQASLPIMYWSTR